MMLGHCQGAMSDLQKLDGNLCVAELFGGWCTDGLLL